MKYFLVILVIVSSGAFISFNFERPSLHSGECISNKSPIFSEYPTEIEKIRQISPPIMQVGSGIKSHSYINLAEQAAVYAPVDSKLITGAKYSESFIDPSQVQYTFLFEVSCEVSYYYDHLVDPPEHIAKLFPDPASEDTSSNIRFDSVEVKAGDIIGYSWSGQFDFGVLNNSKEAPLKDFDEYKHSEKAYADCPLNYYSEVMKETLAELIFHGNMSDLVVIDNLCD